MEGRRGLLLALIIAACFYGNTAQDRTVCTQEAVADIVFMVDGSYSIGLENFAQIRRFLYTLVNSFDVGPNQVRIGLVQYSSTPRTEFLLNTHQNKTDILQYISTLPYMGGGTHTGLGLDFMLNNHFVEAAGSRAFQNVPQIAVVITDGKSQDDVLPHAQDLKGNGIVLYAIGIKDADEDQLKEIANKPHSQHVYSVSDFAALQGISQHIIQTLCTTIDEVKRQLLQLSAECAKATMADIVFLVDSSTSIGLTDFQEVRLFLRSVISGLDIGPDKVRVGLAQYSDQTYKEFLLKDHMDRASLLDQVDNLPYRTGGTEMGKALEFLRTQYFTEEAGSRANQRVPQIAVVLTDGDSVDDVVYPVQLLRKHGVIVFAIGVGQVNMVKLTAIANQPKERFLSKIDNFQALQTLTTGLLHTMCISMDDQRQALAERFADIFFLVDSGIASAQFLQIRTILMRLANQMNIGASAYRFGLAQYGQDVKVEFLLGALQTKEETQNAIKRFRQRRLQPNEPRNLGKALQYASTEFFTTETGSRADQGYRQYLVVFSGKDSDDTVYKQSRKIKSEGVTVVGISQGASMKEMRVIASRPYIYDTITNAVPTLKAVFETQEKNVTVTGECQAAKLADIVFIIDESGSIGGSNFQLVRTFLHSIVKGMNVHQSKVRVGIVMYSDTPQTQFDLNTFNDKDDLLNFIKILPYRGGGTNTGAALQYAKDNVFIKEKGSRKASGVQQVAVVITDGKSQDEVTKAAADLRRANVIIYALGVENAVESELTEIASYPPNKHVFIVDSYSKLNALEQNMQKILCSNIQQVLTINTRRTNIKAGCSETDEADIFFLIDHSGSINPTDFHDMKKFIIEFLHTFRIGPQFVRVGVAKFASSPNLEFDLTTYTDAKSTEKAVLDIQQIGGGTETGKALDFMAPYFERAAVSRGHNVKEYLVVITDGKSTDKVSDPAKRLEKQGVVVYAIGVKGADEEELKEIAGDPKRTFKVNNFDALKPIKDNIITDICSTEVCKDMPGDVMFLIDSSGSIGGSDYQKMKDFMKSVISKSVVSQGQVHFGVMQFSTVQQMTFPLNRYHSKQEMLNAIDAMQQIGGGTHTGEAILELSQYFDENHGGRPLLRQNLIVITDGESQDQVKKPADALRAKGVKIYAIGVDQANNTQLQEISGSMDRVFFERNFDGLKDLERVIALQICEPDRDCKKTEKADIIFLVDTSKSISETELKSMQKFIEATVNKATVGKDLTRFGLIVFSTDVESVFTLKTYDTKNDVLKAVRNLVPLEQDTYTGKALEYTLQFFSAQNGGRGALNVPQILMVITDGEATDPFNLEKPSKALQDIGVKVFSIGVKNANRNELEIMAGHNISRVFFVDNFDILESLPVTINEAICNNTDIVCQKTKADLVFLLDQSTSISRDDYITMKNFTIDVVNSFNIGQESVRIGLAQFSTNFQDEFYLNKFHSKQTVTQRIFEMQQRGGDTYIGLALTSIKEYFMASNGGRKAELVPQTLVLITDGESHDEVEDAADELRALGIQLFAIGIGDIHDLQLLQITGDPENLFTVENFDSLRKIKKKVVDTICKEPSEISSCSIEIAIGFDISQSGRAPGQTLVSSHPKLKNSLLDIVHYVSFFQGLSCTKPVTANIGFRVVTREGKILYDVSFEPYSEEAVTKVMSLNVAEPTAFNTALLKSFGEKFRQSGAGVKVLLLFSDGLDEDVVTLEHESELLRKSGVNALLTVALEGARDPGQLQMVEFGRGFGYQLPLSITMQSVESTIHKIIDSVSDRECCCVLCKCSGHEGMRGSRGVPGSKGVSGQKGYPGFPGDEGTPGDRGLPGPEGPQGVQGCSGPRGLPGSRGLRGNRGENGENGLDAVNGEQGQTGLDGSRGERGRPGNPGIPGLRGEVGQKGQRGLRGDPGEPGPDNNVPGAKGDPGNPGLPGMPGVDGQSGESGIVGNPGPDGRRGPHGEKGRTGQPGDPGEPGIEGASGPRGTRGVRGQPGQRGVPGLPGPQGRPGIHGNPGTKGRPGGNGQKGQPGEPGEKGLPGSRGGRGMPGQDGKDGHGPAGPKGVKGDPGFPGYPGLSGESGLQGPEGHPGPRGNVGRGGNSGRTGPPGVPGEPGYPGHPGSRGPPGSRGKTECELITYIRNNCACSIDRVPCPAYPTELVFGLDMSDDVTDVAFRRQRAAVLSLLDNIYITESNCPTGARVAVVGYNTYTMYLTRFQDYRTKAQLKDSINNFTLPRTTNRRHLGAAMRFVGQNVFKRTRAGSMMRRVAVFFTNGRSQDFNDIVTATMEYRGLRIVPVVISLTQTNISEALEMDDTGNSIFTVLGRNMAADLRKVKNCAICYDPCSRTDDCSFVQEVVQPQVVDMDLVMVADSSREVQADEYAGIQQLLGSVVEQLAVSPQPSRAGNRARVAVIQQGGTRAPKVEFGLQEYQSQEVMKNHLLHNMRQHGGVSALGQTLEYALNQVIRTATRPRRRKVLLTVVGTQTAYEDWAKLHYISQRAQCDGVALFVVTVGERFNRTQVEELASLPLQQHLIHVEKLKAGEQGYAQRFFRVFLSTLSKGINAYPPPSLRRICSQLPQQFPQQEEILITEHVSGQEEAGQVEEVVYGQSETYDENYEIETFDEQRGVKTQTGQLDVIGTLELGIKTKLNDACLQVQDPGSCQNYTMAWFFDTVQNECSRFWYGGCGGNDNRFKTLEECHSLCQASESIKRITLN